jgi:hypothetical protein
MASDIFAAARSAAVEIRSSSVAVRGGWVSRAVVQPARRTGTAMTKARREMMETRMNHAFFGAPGPNLKPCAAFATRKKTGSAAFRREAPPFLVRHQARRCDGISPIVRFDF